MAIVVKLTGDLSDLEAKMKTAGMKMETVGGSADDMRSSFDKVETSLANMEQAALRSAEAVEKMEGGRGIADSMADGFGNSERLLLGVNDQLGVLAEQFGLNLGPAQEYAQAAGDVAGGLEGIIGGGMALGKQLMTLPATMGPVIASTWAHVAALYAQAAAFIAANLPMIALVATVALLAAGVVLLVTHWDEIVEKFPVLGEAADAIQAKLDALTAWVSATFVPGVLAIYEGVKSAVEQAVGFVVDHWDEIRAFIQPAVEGLTMIIQAQIDTWVIIFQTVVGVIKGIIDVFMGVFTGDWERAWDGVKQIVQSVWDGIKGIIETAIGLIKGLAPLILEAGEALGGALLEGLKKALSATAGFAGDVASAVLSAVKGVINSYVIDPLNGALQFSFDTNIPGVGKISINPPDIPRLARGMWEVPGPTGVDQFPALLAGGEMVVPAGPAEAAREMMGSAATARGGGASRGGASSGGGSMTGGGTPASDETMAAAVLEELKKLTTLASRQNDILLEPQVVDFMSRGDPKSLAVLLAPIMADQLAQIYRRQWSPT